MSLLPHLPLNEINSVNSASGLSENKKLSESKTKKVCNDPHQFSEGSSMCKMYALSDHNYTTQIQKLSHDNLDAIRSMLLSVVLPNRIMVKHIPTDIYNFIENTINNLIFYKLEYTSDLDDKYFFEPVDLKNVQQYDIKPKSGLVPILHDTMNFAKQLFYDSKKFLLEPDEKFKEWVTNKLKELKEISNSLKMYTSNMENSKKSKQLLRSRNRNNNKAKRKLLLDSSASSKTDFDIKSSCNEINIETSSEKSLNLKFLSENDFSKYTISQKNFSDGIDLFKYIKLDIQLKPIAPISVKSNTNTRKKSTDYETDRDIERLFDLKPYSKQLQPKLRNVKTIDISKSLEINKGNYFSGTEEDMEPLAKNTIVESEKTIITEVEYVSRYNEEIKNQLLNDSNSDSGLSNGSFHEYSKETSLEKGGTSTNIVDRFLTVFKTDEVRFLEDATCLDSDLSKVSESQDTFGLKSHLNNQGPKSFSRLELGIDLCNKRDEIVVSSESEYSESGGDSIHKQRLKPMLRVDQLANETRDAQKNESDRIRRLEKKNNLLSKAMKTHFKLTHKSDLILDYIGKTKTFIKVDRNIVKHLKSHQKDGVKFMYDSCYGGVDLTHKNSGSGCVLAHCMGLGKTLQLIALLNTVISYKELNTSKILILCPKSTVMNWADEFEHWICPLKDSKKVKVFIFPDSCDVVDKLRILEEWSLSTHEKAGCLLLGYEAFRTLVFYHSYKYKGCSTYSKLESIRDAVKKYLLNPGADIVICDEGHIIKNSRSAISLAVAKIKTRKRIILTGTPIQNNLKEYYSMVNFIKPLYLGTEREFANLYANPIKNGQHKDSSKKDITVMKQRSYVLHKKLSKFVQRKEAELLKTFLPEKFEYVLFIPMTAVQNTLYEYILEAISKRDDCRGKSLITDYTVLRKIWTHPKVLEDAWKNANKPKTKKDSKKVSNSDEDLPDDIYDSQSGVMSVTNDWWRRYLTKKDLNTIIPSNKLRVMFSILRMCEEKGEKCLIFSAFVAVLNVVEYFLQKMSECEADLLHLGHISSNQKNANKWINGQDYYRLDGKTPKNIRHEMIKRFNSDANKRARVFLISSRAGGQGINLIGANRVIILDTSWNPSNDQQNIFRVFRLGQKKNCYIYRLLAMGTMEEKVYSRSVTKQAMSFRVVDEQQIDRHYNMAELAELYTLSIPQSNERTMPLLPKDTVLADLLRQTDLVYKYHEHDSLLENKVEQELSEQEKADAWDTYEKELQINYVQKEHMEAEKINFSQTLPLQSYLGALKNVDDQKCAEINRR
ncbi:transcriptional regulator ATRX homolog isoform X3 [Drosophila bipectinata]|uniref:transcriptional regulator ATRX homolog isoform X3 n=1 Tax=Drosophila bipectinata TaxID=42026 RepID=UPI001C890B31|nr:transcriptional regulator ATRX homolog isoform X3 [Drosophila bipectinata]XP_043066785.1 transcriptional regulator ATRX homolog isoform X3 [Drosophila bipectinata]